MYEPITLTDEHCLYFNHIPKTSGSSLTIFLEDHFPMETVRCGIPMMEALRMPPHERRTLRCLCGHYMSFLVDWLGKTPVYLAMLRDPVERSISHYFHILNHPDNPHYELAHSMDFSAFLRHPWGRAELTNFQARHLAFDNIQEEYFGYSEHLTTGRLEAWTERLSAPALLARAEARVEAAAFVGLCERFLDSQRVLCHMFDWPVPGESYHYYANAKRPKRESISAADLALIEEYTAFDRILYDQVAARLEPAAAAATRAACAAKYEAAMARHPRVTQVYYGFENPLFGSGWYVRERAGGPETVYRWTGPRPEAFFDVCLDPERDYEIAFWVGVYWERLEGDQVTLTVNDEPVPLSFCWSDDLQRCQGIFRGTLPAAALKKRPAFARVTFTAAQVIYPPDVDPNASQDHVVGLYFRWVEIAPSK